MSGLDGSHHGELEYHVGNMIRAFYPCVAMRHEHVDADGRQDDVT